jgi:carbamoyltransferase
MTNNTRYVWGISANSHDAAIAVFKESAKGLTANRQLTLEFASQSERFSRIKNDPHLNRDLLMYAEREFGAPDEVVWYEKPWKKTLRQLRAGQGWKARENDIRWYLDKYNLLVQFSTVDHHRAHAATGYYTSNFSSACIICLDAIGEFETLTIWKAVDNRLKKIFSQSYPHSVGLWYSAMTQRIGLKPQEDEYILMGMAAYGDPNRFFDEIRRDLIDVVNQDSSPRVVTKTNLHRGCQWWKPELTSEQDLFDIAAGTQAVYQYILKVISNWARYNSNSGNLVLMGGCALNCSANSTIYKDWENVWIMPNPGDAGSAVGAVLAKYKQHIEWTGPYLGYNIEGEYPVEEIIKELLTTGICGVANGPSEYGPRALGNRSLLADPRGPDIKHRVNNIKQRQQFRPFAPAILAEFADQYFDGPTGPYMQYTSTCRYPELYPAIVHRDNTSRVQTVGRNDPGAANFRRLLEEWYKVTGCPMLLNTSLNIKGEPIVNNQEDAKAFETKYGVRVFCRST